ncbi:hypothetical protein [Streptomyces tauricus]
MDASLPEEVVGLATGFTVDLPAADAEDLAEEITSLEREGGDRTRRQRI